MTFEPRALCNRCRRPTSVCYCAALPTLPTATRVVILQHPRERDMPIGTARMASLCLPNSELHVGVRWADHRGLARALSDPARPPILLYPGPGARDILREPPEGPVTLVVVDGTWSQAKSVVRDNPILHALPRYAFATPEPSQYRIRREPRAEYVSTIEALMYVLGALEGDPAPFRSLLDPLNAMVDAQLACQAARPQRRVRVPRKSDRRGPALPPILGERFEDLVCVVGEANAWPYRDNVKHARDELVHWVACRPSTGETFSAIAAPTGALAPSTSFHIGLDEATLLGAGTRAELCAAFARFLRPTDVVGAWGTYSLDLFEALPSRADLRAIGQRLANAKLGGLETYAATLGIADGFREIPGRAGRRLAALVGIVERWRSAPDQIFAARSRRATERTPVPTPSNPSLSDVDWSKLPVPVDDGAMRHLEGAPLPDVALRATDGSSVSLAKLPGRTILFAYPRTGKPGEPALAEDWDQIPGARGCTPQTCSFRDLHRELVAAGASQVFGLSTQTTEDQREAHERLHLPFELLSDIDLALANAARLPTFEVAGIVMHKRFAMVIDDGKVTKVFYPVFPPDQSARVVHAWLVG